MISYDIESRSIHVELSDEEIQHRVATFDKEIHWEDGYLGLYQSWVGSLAKGAVHSGK